MKWPSTLADLTRSLGEGFVADQAPEIVGEDPVLLHTSPAVAQNLGLSQVDLDSPEFVKAMAGHTPIGDFSPFASVYSGHQFGHYVPQLGDGRAVTIAEGYTPQEAPFSLQLKGAGRTPFSRFGDGRAVMRSSIREYLCSEHMAALGIPTTRALSLVATREGVQREEVEPGAIVSRVAESFIRFGHFEYFHYTEQPDKVMALAEHVVEHHFPHLHNSEDPVAAMFGEVVSRTAEMIAQWMAVGFSHGVMNTDNMSILGLTIDYGPFGFLDKYDPAFVCNHSDTAGRYAFNQQPHVGMWNVHALASALTSVVESADLEETLKGYAPLFSAKLDELMNAKLGLGNKGEEHPEMWQDLVKLMRAGDADFTITFRQISDLLRSEDRSSFASNFTQDVRPELDEWMTAYLDIIPQSEDLADQLDSTNPNVVLRNWVAENAIRAIEDEGDTQTLDRVFSAVTQPFSSNAQFDAYAASPPETMQGLAVSCSS